jgi:hypothetical protein
MRGPRAEGIRRLSFAVGALAASPWLFIAIWFGLLNGEVAGMQWVRLSFLAVTSFGVSWIVVQAVGWVWNGFSDARKSD